MLITINNMLSKMDEIERSNQLKDKKIHELEYILRKHKTAHNFNFSMVEKPRGLVDTKIIKYYKKNWINNPYIDFIELRKEEYYN